MLSWQVLTSRQVELSTETGTLPDAAEVAVKTYRAGDREERHHHKVATELTLILSGEVRMNGTAYHAGDVVRIEPGESTDFEAVTDVTTVVVKVPSVADDKYLG